MLSKGISGYQWRRVTIIPFTKTLFYGFAFLVMHDYDHYVTGSDWSLEGEITAYKAAASRAPRNSKDSLLKLSSERLLIFIWDTLPKQFSVISSSIESGKPRCLDSRLLTQ